MLSFAPCSPSLPLPPPPRPSQLLTHFDEIKPHVLVIEMFPFGRRKFHFELEPLLNRAYESLPARPAILVSVRDVLVVPRGGEHLQCAKAVEQYFDQVLVHGDPNLLPFEETFLETARLLQRDPEKVRALDLAACARSGPRNA